VRQAGVLVGVRPVPETPDAGNEGALRALRPRLSKRPLLAVQGKGLAARTPTPTPAQA